MRTKLNVECQLERVRYRERQTKEGYVQYTGLNQENAGVQVGICTPPMLERLTFVINVYFTCLVIRNITALCSLGQENIGNQPVLITKQQFWGGFERESRLIITTYYCLLMTVQLLIIVYVLVTFYL